MKLLTLYIVTLVSLQATIWEINTNQYYGRLVIEAGDIVIISSDNPLSKITFPRNVIKYECSNVTCRDAIKMHYKLKYKINKINYEEIK